ncbi:DUF6527 family protein [Paenarthrobacter sp. Z7-10]|uniref:DUF6527 family protein n=1 Tax=Paenarthrobacter sp. Z7-10 TaxID=2787635 RepID=UPI003FA75AA9
MRLQSLDPEFVEFIPSDPIHGKLYISMVYATTVHLCACGCGNKVVLPLSPAEWQLSYDGDAIDIRPSVGNGEFPCRSHYWISGNKIRWSPALTGTQIATSRRRDAAALSAYISSKDSDRTAEQTPVVGDRKTTRFLQELRKWLKI